MEYELEEFVRNDIWKLVPLPYSVNVVGTKWIFKNKTDDIGCIVEISQDLLLRVTHKLKESTLMKLCPCSRTWSLSDCFRAPRAWYERLTKFLTDTEKLVQNFVKSMTKEFKMSMVGELKYFLGLQVIRLRKVSLFLKYYAKNLLVKFGLEKCKEARTPMSTPQRLERMNMEKMLM
ncbi:unnamed protein product [Microthlaspi erraticum]|uniref:Reverse transcriptase Ty1/copia-type domain-containing protein n=1 Tax=Microthlaspi erraticum TaxID=1685480 RepID=A0A6D2JH96_9BRAS|nr:unnamed protein product [Microthlaspi erraticum]